MLFPKRNAIGPKERAAILECMEFYRQAGEDLPYGGEFNKRYSAALCTYFGLKHTLTVSSGTAALFVALKALNLPEDSTVICSPITDPGCISAVAMNGLNLRLADTAADSFSMDPAHIVARLNADVSAVMYVHAAGHATDLSDLRHTLDQRGVYLIEDISQAHGARCNGKIAGQYGHIAAISTMYRKAHISGSNGGAILTNDPELYRRAVMHADRGKDKLATGFDDRDPAHYDLPGLNFNLDEIACAIGVASLGRLDETRKNRSRYVTAVRERLAQSSPNFRISDLTTEDSPFLVPVRCPPGWSVEQKIAFAEKLRDGGVPLNPHYKYLVAEWDYAHKLGLSLADVPRAKAAQNNHFCLYVNENYGEAEAEFVVSKIQALMPRGA
jgi:perosamine synthetase